MRPLLAFWCVVTIAVVAALTVTGAAWASSWKPFIAPRSAAYFIQLRVDGAPGNYDVACAAFTKYVIQCSGEWQSKLIQQPDGGYDPPLRLHHSYVIVVHKLDRHTVVFDSSTNGRKPRRQIVRIYWNA